MKKLIEAMEKDRELTKVVFGDDTEAAYRAANTIEPCDKKEFESFRKEQLRKSDALNKVAEAALSDEELARILFGADRKAAYEAALSIVAGDYDDPSRDSVHTRSDNSLRSQAALITEAEFETAMRAVREKIDLGELTDEYEPPDVELTEEDLDRVHGEGFFFIPVFFAANANAIANANVAFNANAASNANAVSNANTVANVNYVANANAHTTANANVNWNANINVNANANDWKKR